MRVRRLKERQHLVELAEEMAGVGYWRIDAATREHTWSPQIARIYGLDPDRLDEEQIHPGQFYHPDDRATAQAKIDAALSEGAPFSYELRVVRPDGELRYVMAKGAAERGADGHIIAIFGTFMDVTEAKRAEEVLRASEARYRVFADNSTDMIMMSGLDRRLTYISPAVARVTGYPPEMLMGRRVADLVHPDDAPMLTAAMALIYDGDGHTGSAPSQIEYRARHRDGRWLWLETRSSVIRDPQTGEPTGAMSVAREITARRALEAELQQRTLEAQAATEAKSDFLANMSHEIRTPLTAILGFSRMLRGLDDMPPEAAQHLQRIATAGEALLSVVNDILDFSKLDAGQLELDARPFDPAGFVRETLDLVAEQAALKGLSVKVELAEGLPPAIMADSGRLRQILLNLLGNAIKFTKTGGIRVAVRHGTEMGGRLHIAVSDTGAGVPADRRDRLFQRFSQVDGSVSRHHGGSGLGLAICKRLAEIMGGDVGVDSVEGQGSTFWFHIAAPPAVIDYDDLFEDDEEAAMTPLRLLVVDDLAVNRELALAILTPFGHDVVEACGGQEAVAAAGAEVFDLILMDLQMPGMDGMSATRAIRAGDGPNRATPILALSADVLAGQQAACRAAGMNDHIAKPIDVADLLSKVAYWTRTVREADLEIEPVSAAG